MIARLANLLHRVRRKQFVRDTAVMQVASVVTAITYLATSVLIGRHLGHEELGRWVAARELFSMVFMTLSAGLVQVSVARYSRAVGSQQRAERVQALAALFKLYLVAALLVLLAGALLAPGFAEIQYGDREVGVIAAILCTTGLAEALKSVMVVSLQGTRWMADYARFEISINVVRLGLIATVVSLDFGLPGVMWAFVAHALVVSIWSLVVYARLQLGERENKPPPLREVLGAVSGASVRELFNTAYFLSIFKVMNTLIPRMGNVIIPMAGITLAGSFGEGGHFFVAYVVAQALAELCASVNKALMPALGLKLGKTDVPFDQMGRLILRVTLISGTCMTLVAAASIPVMHSAFGLLWGEEFAQAANFYPWLALGVGMTGFAVAVEPFYIYSGKMSFALRQNIVFGLLALAMIVTGAMTHGPKGVAVATGLCRCFGAFHLVYIWCYFRGAAVKADPS